MRAVRVLQQLHARRKSLIFYSDTQRADRFTKRCANAVASRFGVSWTLLSWRCIIATSTERNPNYSRYFVWYNVKKPRQSYAEHRFDLYIKSRGIKTSKCKSICLLISIHRKFHVSYTLTLNFKLHAIFATDKAVCA